MPEVHADGEIWVETLWDLRTRLIADHGAGTAIDRARALITDGLRLAPANPTFLDMRNAILQADLNRSFGDRDRIWAVFAARGMGYRASHDRQQRHRAGRRTSRCRRRRRHRRRRRPADEHRAVDHASLSHVASRRIRGRPGAHVQLPLSEPATATIAIERAEAGRRVGRRCRPPSASLRRRPRCTRYVRVGQAGAGRTCAPAPSSCASAAGSSSRALHPGRYRATLVATDIAGNRSRAVRLTLPGRRAAETSLGVEDWLTAAAAARPDHVALVADEGTLTFAELDERADRRARELAAAGVAAGDRVAVSHPPGLAFAELLHALPRLGAVLEPGPPAEPPEPPPGAPGRRRAAAHDVRPRGGPHRDPHLRHHRRAQAGRADLRQPRSPARSPRPTRSAWSPTIAGSARCRCTTSAGSTC